MYKSRLLSGALFFSVLLGTQGLQFNVLNTGNVYRFTTNENTGEDGRSLGTVTCTEVGGASPNGPVTYTILQQGSLPFTLDSNSGDLSLRAGEVLDFEDTQEYLFNVSCAYTSNPAEFATALVRFSVEPVNEFLPMLSDVSLRVTINEETPVGTILVSTDGSGGEPYTVTDEDDGPDGELRFIPRLDSLDLTEFSLDVKGSLVLLQTIDLDTGDASFRQVVYDMIVCDGNRDEQECPSVRITIFILAANDNPPIFEQDEYTISVSEATPIGTSLITVVCTDADRNGVGEFRSISINSSNTPVDIPNEKNGTVILKENLDFESTSILTVSLICQDSDFFINATLIIMITPVNDHAPRFNNTLIECIVGRLAIIGEEICAVQAVDNDIDDRILYTLSGPGNENFQIRPDGILVLNDIVLVAEGSFFELTVSASDGIFNDSTTVRITVTDLLSIPEIIIVAVCGVVLILVVIIVTVICCCCFIGCYRCLPEKKKKTGSDEEMLDQLDYFHPALMPPQSMYDHGGPLYQMAQNPHLMDDEWHGSQDLLTEEGEEDTPDITLNSNPSSSRVYNPNTLNKIVDIFHEGDKVLGGKKKKKDKK